MSFIKLDRAFKNWRYKDKPEYVALWVELLLSANWEEKQWHNITIHKGELVTSYSHLAKETGLSVQNVRTILGNLIAEELTIKSTNKYTLIHINKWGQYQCVDENITSKLTNNQQTINKQLTTTKEYIKNNKKLKNIWETLPIYDGSNNNLLNEDELNKILSERKATNEQN